MSRKTNRKDFHLKPVIEAMEPRILFSADFAVLLGVLPDTAVLDENTLSSEKLTGAITFYSTADVIASIDVVGYVNRDGDPKCQLGDIEAVDAFSPDVEDSWKNILAILNRSTFNDSSEGGETTNTQNAPSGSFAGNSVTNDDGTETNSSSTRGSMNVLSLTSSRANNNAPTFLPSGPFNVDEGAVVTTVVGDVDADDGDGGVTDTGITYSITSNVNPDADGNNAFVIDSTSGLITVNDAGDLDFEGTTPLIITVQADDGGFTSSISVTINLNDVAPTLTATGAANINAGEIYVLDLTATEPGTSGITTYTVNWGDGNVTTEAYTGPTTSVSHVYNDVGFTHHITFAANDVNDTWTASELITGNWIAGTDDVFFIDGVSGNVNGMFDTTGSDLTRPYGIAVGPDGNIYVAGYSSNNIVSFTADGSYNGIFNAHGQLNNPTGLAWGSDGNLYVANYGGNNILRIDSDGAFIDVWGAGGPLDGPESLVFSPDGDLYVSSWDNKKVVMFDGASGGMSTLVINAGLNNPEQIVFDGAGNLYIANSTNNEVLRWDGVALSTYFTHADLSFASGLAFGPDGQLYVSSHDNDKILRYNGVTGEVFTDDGPGGLDAPTHLVFTPDHRVTIVLNTAPTATNLSTTSLYSEGDASVAISNIVVSDVDSAETITATLTLANTATGNLSANDGATYTAGTGVWTITDSVANVNAALANLIFSPTTNNDLDTTISVDIDDDDEDLSGALTGTITLDVTPVNDAPVLDAIGNQSVDELATLSFTATATDNDLPGDNLSFKLDAVSIALGMTINPVTGAFSWTPTEAQGGLTPSVTITVTDDGTGDLIDSETITITVNDLNTAPVLSAIGNQTIDEGSTLTFTATATDTDNPTDNLTYTLDAPSIALGMAINPTTGAFSWTPTEAQGGLTPSVTITVTDDGTGDLIDSETITITVNDLNTAPVLSAIGNQSVDEGSTLTFTATATDTDNPNDNLTYTLDAPSIALGMTIDSTTGAFSWTPTEAQGGLTPSVTITVTDDGTGDLIDSETITITVNDLNTAPVLSAIGNQIIDEGSTLTFTATATDTDNPTDNLTYTLDAPSIALGMTINPTTGAFSWTPTEAQGGLTPSVTITVTDDGTGNLIDSETITITVNDLNTAPVLSTIGNQIIDEGSTLTFTATAIDTDNPTDNLTYTLDAPSIALGMTINPTTGAFSWTPTEAQGGLTPSVTITVTDDGTGNLIDSETITITVNDLNTAPVLSTIGNQIIDEGSTLTFTATAIDTDNPTDNLTYTLDAPSIALGMTINPTTGAFSWTPTEAQGGLTPSVTITVTDDGTGNLIDSETITITVNDLNTAPVLSAIGNQSVDEGSTLTFTATATDSDNPNDNLTYTLDAPSIALGMTINPTTGAFSWTPTEAQGGLTPSVTITVTDDGTGNLIDSETITITVNDLNTAPVLSAIGNQSVDEGSTLTFTATATDSDNPNDNLTYTLDAPSIALGMTINPTTGAFSWTPTEAQGGLTPSVTITVTDDGTGNLIDSETITITVNDLNTAPVLSAIGNQSVDEGSTLTFTATATDSDNPTDNLTYTLDAPSIALGMTINPTTGAFSWTPTEAQGGLTPLVTITVTDDGTGNLIDSETITITVNDLNTAPVLSAIGNQIIDEGSTLTFTATATDTDNPTDNLTYTLDAPSIALGMTINPGTGAFSWTPTEAQGGLTPSVTITVTDDGTGNLIDSEIITITVDEVNAVPTLSTTAISPTFTEGGAAVGLFSATSVSTIENGQTIESLSMTVSAVIDGANEILNLDGSAIGLTNANTGITTTNSLSYSVSLSGSTATLTLSGGALTITQTQALVDTLSYQNDSLSPTEANRVVTLTELVDSGGTTNGGDDTATLFATSTVTVQSINSEPTLVTTASNPTFTEGGPSVGLFSATNVSTVENGQTISSLTMTISNVLDGANEKLSLDGSIIALTDGNNGLSSTNSLSYTVNLSDDTATVVITGSTLSTVQTQSLVDTLGYQNDSTNPTSASRVVTLTQLIDSGGTVNGGNDTNLLNVSTTVAVLPVNNEQTITINTGISVLEGSTANVIDSTSLNTTDVDNTPTEIIYTLTGNPVNGSLRLDGIVLGIGESFTQDDINNDLLTFDHDGSESTSADLTFTVNDPAGTVSTGLLEVTVLNVNDSDPQADDEIINVAEGGVATEAHLVEGATLLDGDIDLDLPYDVIRINETPVVAPMHGDLILNADGTFIYTHNGSENHIDQFSYELADENGGLIDIGSVMVHISPVNDAPVLAIPPDPEITIEPISFTLPAATFFDADSDNLTYSAKLTTGEELPDWLTFDASTLTFTITSVAATNLNIEVVLVANDDEGATASTLMFFRSAPQIAEANAEFKPQDIHVNQNIGATQSILPLQESPQSAAASTDQAEPALATELISQPATLDNTFTPIHLELNGSHYQQAEELVTDISRESNHERQTSNLAAELLRNNNLIPLARLFELQDENTTIMFSNLSESMDRFRKELEDDSRFSTQVVGASTMLTSGLSVGYVLWLIRGGTLIGSMLASLPAWRLIDPLPILDSLNDDETDEDSESLESMVKTEYTRTGSHSDLDSDDDRS